MTSSAPISNHTSEWIEHLRLWHMEFFFIPTTIVSVATLLANPILLACIFLSRALRQETRYLLVANTLMADTLFLVLNMSSMISNIAMAEMPWLLCEIIIALSVTAYCCAILTITFMVIDTYAAVRWPLHYHDFLPPARTHCILVGTWVLALIYPLAVVILTAKKRGSLLGNVSVCLAIISLGFNQDNDIMVIYIYFFVGALTCAFLIFYCYIRLYMVTRIQGIWHSRFSRARVTLLAHGLLLLLYFTPGFVFIMELYLSHRKDISQNVRVWISMVNLCIFMMLPRALAPYVYGLRYREISETLMQLLKPQRRLSQVTVS